VPVTRVPGKENSYEKVETKRPSKGERKKPQGEQQSLISREKEVRERKGDSRGQLYFEAYSGSLAGEKNGIPEEKKKFHLYQRRPAPDGEGREATGYSS